MMMRVSIVFAVCMVLHAPTVLAGPVDDQAAEILKATGVQGGLIVHLGCGDGKLTAALHVGDRYLIHGLDTRKENVQQAREHIRSRGLYGKVSVDRLESNRLPYIDNLVNLVVAQDLGNTPLNEVMRVLAPQGIAYIQKGGEWIKTVKPRPNEIDEWTHYLHGPDNNAVANDSVVAPPKGLQWVSGPLWSRGHTTLNGTSCMASAQGRLFTIEDLAPIELPLMPGKYTLVARDAFNGIVLWKRPLENWENITHWMKPTPVQLSRRLVATGDRVYVTLGIFAPVTALDAGSGRVVKVYEGTEKTQEIIYSDGVIYVATGDPMNPYGLTAKRSGYRPQFAVYGEGHYSPRREPKQNPEFAIVAVDSNTGDVLWKKSGGQTSGYQATSLAVRGDAIVYQTKTELVRLARSDGRTVWKKSSPVRMEGDFKLGGSSPTVVLTDDVILRADNKNLIAYSADNGEELWRTPTTATYFSSPDIFVVGDVVWPYPSTNGHDILTGKIVGSRRITRDGPMGHDRCHRNKATVNYLINSRSGGADFSKLNDDWSLANPWIRGTCSLGIMPCNGLLYASPHACSCANEAKLNGFYALNAIAYDTRKDNILQEGPAFEKIPHSAFRNPHSEWPTYRQDMGRSGNARTSLTTDIEPLWKAKIPNPTAPVIAAGRVLVAGKDVHTLYCLDSTDGKTVWTFMAGGRIDSPPTVVKGRVLFGSADGWVYCLSAETGELAWRFRAAPQQRSTVAFGQIESLWPLHGSVLVLDDIAYFSAGRQSFINGGIYLYGLDIYDGDKKFESRIAGPYGEDGESVFEESTRTKDSRGFRVSTQIKGNLSDILLSDGEFIYLRHMAFEPDLTLAEKEKAHLMTVSGFLDGSGHHRSYWTIARRLIYDTTMGGNVDVDLLVMEGEKIFGTRIRSSNRSPQEFDPRERGFTLFAMTKTKNGTSEKTLPKRRSTEQSKRQTPATKSKKRKNQTVAKKASQSGYRLTWDTGIPVNGKAMLKAGEVLFIAGTPNEFPEEDLFRAVEGRAGGILIAASAVDGKTLKRYDLQSPPVWDGMAAAGGRLYISLQNGDLQCWEKR